MPLTWRAEIVGWTPSEVPAGCRSRRENRKTVRIRRGPAAVTGDEGYTSHCGRMPREDVANRSIRKPEDLPLSER